MLLRLRLRTRLRLLHLQLLLRRMIGRYRDLLLLQLLRLLLRLLLLQQPVNLCRLQAVLHVRLDRVVDLRLYRRLHAVNRLRLDDLHRGLLLYRCR